MAKIIASTAIANTIKRPTQTNSFCDAFLRKNALYKSSVRVVEHTSNWQLNVLMTAAKIAAKTTPAIHGLNKILVNSMNTVSGFLVTVAANSG